MNTKSIILGAILLASPLVANADIADWIADQIRQEAENQINSVIYSTRNNLGQLGNMLWDGIVESKAESDLNAKAREFKNFPINDSGLSRAQGFYPQKYLWSNYAEISSIQRNLVQSNLYTVNNFRLSQIGRGSFGRNAEAYVDSLKARSKISDISAVLSKQSIDSVSMFEAGMPGFKETLLEDIQHTPELGNVINNHPEAVRVYYNSFSVPLLRKSPGHLYYWAVTADSHKNEISGKKKLLNPREFSFRNQNGHVAIMHQGREIAQLSDDEITVIDINFMNLKGRPISTYKLENNLWRTDKFGRVIEARQRRNKTNKRKLSQKSDIKYSDLIAPTKADKTLQPFLLNSKEYGGPEVYLNISYYNKTVKANKDQLKLGDKHFKSALKTAGETDIITLIDYNLCHMPSSAEIRIEGQSYPLVVATEIAKNNLKPSTPLSQIRSDKKFVEDLKSKPIQPKYTKPIATTTITKEITDTKPYNPQPAKSSGVTHAGTDAELRKLASDYGLNAKKYEINYYQGDVGSYPIVMTLIRDYSTSKAVGILYYKSQGPYKKLIVKGSYLGNHCYIFDLEEYDKGKYNGRFELEDCFNGTITGSYGNIKNKIYTVHLTEIK